MLFHRDLLLYTIAGVRSAVTDAPPSHFIQTLSLPVLLNPLNGER